MFEQKKFCPIFFFKSVQIYMKDVECAESNEKSDFSDFYFSSCDVIIPIFDEFFTITLKIKIGEFFLFHSIQQKERGEGVCISLVRKSRYTPDRCSFYSLDLTHGKVSVLINNGVLFFSASWHGTFKSCFCDIVKDTKNDAQASHSNTLAEIYFKFYSFCYFCLFPVPEFFVICFQTGRKTAIGCIDLESLSIMGSQLRAP